jgi:hypothetical protein
MSANPPIPIEDVPEVRDTFVSFVAGAGLDETGIVMVTLATDRLTVGPEPKPFRRVCARLIMAEITARELANTLLQAVNTAEAFRTQQPSPN